MDIPVKELRDALELLDPAVPHNTTLPVLHNILLEGTRARATDLEVLISVDLEREVGDPFCIPHPQLYDLLKYTPGHTMLELIPGTTLSVKMRAGTASLAAGQPDEYPPVPTLDDPKVAVLDGTALTRALNEILPFAAREASRPVLTAVCVTLGDPVEVAAADGFRLAILQVPAKLDHLGDQKVLIPAHAIKVLAHLWKYASVAPSLQEEDGPAQMAIGKRLLRLEYNDTLARITFGKITLITQLVQGAFPNYANLVPKDQASAISFLAEDVRRAVGMLAPTAKKGSDIIRLQWADSVLTLQAAAKDEGDVSTEVRLLNCTQPMRIAFKSQYLAELVKGQTGIVTMETSTPSSPAVFKAAGHPLVVLMPMFVQWDGVQPEGKTEAQVAEDGQAGVSGSPHDGDTEGPQSAVPPQKVRSAAKKTKVRRTRKAA